MLIVAAVAIAQERTPSNNEVSPEQQKPESKAPTGEKDEVSTPPQVSADDILKEFQKDRPKAQPIMPGTAPDEEILRNDEDTPERRKLRFPDGFFLVDRTGRLTQEGEWWVFTFVSDNNPAEMPDPPMKLLPNQMLERMVRESEGAARTVDFVVSGEVTDFMGENYLLLRKLMRKRDMGNLSR